MIPKIRTYALLNSLAVAALFVPDSAILSAAQRASDSDQSVLRPLPEKPIRDVRLRDGGRVTIQVLDDAGQALTSHTVNILHKGNVVATASSNHAGRIQVSGLRPGIHLMSSGQSAVSLRFWMSDMAPPQAVSSTAIVVSQPTVRGQYGAPMMAPAMLATGGAVAGLAAVLAGKNSGDHSVPVPPASP